MVRQLFDNKKQRPVTIDDVETVTGPEEKYEYLEEKAEVSYNGLQFRLFTHRRQPFNSDYIKQRNRMKEDVSRDQPPIQVYEWENGERFVNKGRTAWELWRRWKEGCYNVYWIGGQPPMEYVLKKTWIRKID